MKHFFLSIISIATLLGATNLWAVEKIEEVEQYEIRSYDPQKSGLNDLVFEARIDNLTEILNKTGTFGKLIDVYFKIYWLSPSQYKIEVMGLPKGFPEVRSDLSDLIKGKLEFIIPEKFSEKFKGYSLKAEPVADGKLIRAIDDTYTMAVPEVDMVFDTSGKLKTVETKATYSNVKTEFFQSPKAWSAGKLVMDKIVTTSKQGATSMLTTNTVDYVTVSGMGFPSKVTIKNVAETIVPATKKDKEKKVKNESGTIVKFSKYEVNTGKAKRFMTEGTRS
ncbi:MAG: hypothetical protein H7177_13445 [Rhizobacter sp.]|nr:hypothetical protein [Bacteriovorax sp.]